MFVSKFIAKSENQHSTGQTPISQSMKETFKFNIFVRFVPKDTTEEEFTETMKKAGKIMSVKFREIGNDANGKSSVNHKVGYVCYEKVEEAQKCI